ncbi:hypothetical protein Ddye_024740 [Dipteronia dyeriana]|uniref:Reverse transcriptase domain-containing protein n=1 Tax=Dipteronia dyeriana TaxID=168575 RepID=A0AAD9WUJ0_9ROSI|nr:hypothetical protein Ddye_024740 [Dipteronia dyeriana]
MEKCLRQGDPISPLFFNIAVEGLNVLLQRAQHLELIEGEGFEEDNVNITHLQFADDAILFLKPRMKFILIAKRVLRCFELASGLKINFHKSCVVQMGMMRSLGFLWGDGEWKRKLHAVNWKEVCKQKDKGGLSIGRILDKNKVLLVKWLWRFGREDKALWKKVIGSKYRVDDKSLFWNWQGSSCASFFVKSMRVLLKDGSLTCRVIKDGFQTIVRSGDEIDLWSDICCEGIPLKVAFPRCFALTIKKCGTVQKFGN